jgi:hypothetical protein
MLSTVRNLVFVTPSLCSPLQGADVPHICWYPEQSSRNLPISINHGFAFISSTYATGISLFFVYLIKRPLKLLCDIYFAARFQLYEVQISSGFAQRRPLNRKGVGR